jgi:glycosyltransferase involved in cell wall biosynthesis
MQVLLWMPEGKVPGGHRVQLEKTAEALRALGLGVRIEDGCEPDLSDIDVVHGFRLSAEQIRRCRLAGVPVALSTIWWSRDYRAGLTQRPWHPEAVWNRSKFGLSLATAAVRGRHVDKAWNWLERWQSIRVTYELADILLPNSGMEAKAIQDDLGVTTPMRVVPNAVDESAFSLPEAGDDQSRQGALYVGRVEPHKNQLGAMQAMRRSSVPLTVMGPPHPHHSAYYDRCSKAARGQVRLEPGVEHEALPQVYRRHKVHVLPSWFETTGLVSLEAALCGCNIVTTNRGFAREYFGDLAWYCDPGKPASIREAVEAAEAALFRQELRERILEKYTWSATALATVDAYQRILLPDRTARTSEPIVS